MKLFYNKTFDGHWGVGTAAIVIAETPAHAAELLQLKLDEIGLPQVVLPEDMIHVKGNKPQVLIINDGNY